MVIFRSLWKVSPQTPKLANMLEGGGKTPILLPADLEEIGFKLVSYPLSLLGSSIGAMESALVGLKSGRIPQLPSFSHVQKVIGFPEYYANQERYDIGPASSNTKAPLGTEPPSVKRIQDEERGAHPDSRDAVDPDEVLEHGDESGTSGYSMPSPGERSLMVASNTKTGGQKKNGKDIKQIRLVVKNRETNLVKLETCVPTSFLSAVASLVPDDDGNDFETIVNSVLGIEWEPSKPIISFPSKENIVEVYLE